jgi:hypothetical protein
VFTWGNGGTITESQQLSGGNPDEYLRVTIQVNSAPNAANFARVAAAYINNNAVYDPATQGAIAGINFAQDAKFFSGVGAGEAIRPALMQGGQVFIANPVQTSPSTQWTTMVANNRQPTDFFLPSEDLAPITRPNFSATGQPITLGFVRFNTTTGAPFTNVGGVDNWRAEVISITSGYSVNEGQPLTLDGSRSTDPDSTNPPQNNNDIVLYEWDLNYDGATFDADVSSGSSTSTVSFPNNFTARPLALRVKDSVGATSIATTMLQVLNIAPTLTVDTASLVINEGQTAINSGTFNDVPADIVTISAPIGNIVNNGNGTWSWSYNGQDDLATTMVTVTAKDDDGGQTQKTFSLKVDNVAPAFEAGSNELLTPSVVGAFQRTINFTDAGLLDVHTVTVNYGDGSGNQSFTVTPTGSRSFTLSHTYTIEGTFNVSVTLQDDDLGSAIDSFAVEVILNEPPVAVAGGPYIVNEGSAATLDGSGSTDPDSTNSPQNDNDIVRYEWDLDYDGVSFDVDVSSPSPTAVSSIFADNFATRAIALRVTDSRGETDLDTSTLLVSNVAPVVNAGGAQSANEGAMVSLSGTFTDPGTADTHTETWSVVASNGQVIPAGSGASFNFVPNDNGTYTVTYTVTDDDGGTNSDTAVVTVNNVAPTARANSYTSTQGVTVTGNVISDNTGSGVDSDPAGANDPLVIISHTNPTNGTLTLSADGSFTYSPDSTFAGVDSFTYTISDGDGGFHTATVTINISAAAAGSIITIADTCLGGTALVITGTSGNDSIKVEPGTSSSTLKVNFNGTITTVAKPTGRIIITGEAGDDTIHLAGAILNQAWLYGDAGNDRLNNGNGGGLLFGDDGNDELTGGGGRDIMIGGQGADKLIGNSDDDILVAGYTARDNRSSPNHGDFWCGVVHEWNSNRSFAERVDNLRDELLPEVIDDAFADDIDFLNGSSGNDWLIFKSGEDKVAGQIEAGN